jgi:hypothetical protein
MHGRNACACVLLRSRVFGASCMQHMRARVQSVGAMHEQHAWA